MSKFLTKLEVRWESEDDDEIPQWLLLEDLVYQSDLLGRDFVVPAGFVTDFASVPRAPIAYLMAGNTGHRAAVVHDYLIRSGEVEREMADEVFKEALSASGVDWWRTQAMYLGVSSYTSALREQQNPLDPPSG